MKTTVVLTGLLAATLTVSALAQSARPRDGERRGPPPAEQMDLNPEQAAQVAVLREAFQDQMAAMRSEHLEAMAEIRRLMEDESITETEVINATERAGRLQTAIQIERTRHLFALKAIVGHEKALAWANRWRDRMRDELGDRTERPERAERMERQERRERGTVEE